MMAALPLYRAKKRRAPLTAQPEAPLQAAIVQHLKLCGAPGVLWFHPPNEARRSYGLAASLKALGMLAGVADLVLVHEGRTYFLEIKAAGGRLSDAQREFAGRATAAGARWAVAYSIDAAITILRDWQLIRRAVRAA